MEENQSGGYLSPWRRPIYIAQSIFRFSKNLTKRYIGGQIKKPTKVEIFLKPKKENYPPPINSSVAFHCFCGRAFCCRRLGFFCGYLVRTYHNLPFVLRNLCPGT